MRVGILGTGSVGAMVGGRLAIAGHDVLFLGRPVLKERVAASGMTLLDVDTASHHLPAERCHVETEPAALATCDVVLVCVKGTATKSALNEVAPHLHPNALLVSFQNGVRNAERIREALAINAVTATVAAGIVNFNVVSLDNATYAQTTDGALTLERADHPQFSAVTAALKSARFDVVVSDEIVREQYSKLVVNLNNAIIALSGRPTVQVLGDKAFRHVIAAVAGEALDVLAAAGIRPARFRGVPLRWMTAVLRWPSPLVRFVLRAQLQMNAEARSSMWEDLMHRRPTEIADLNGEIVRLADTAGIEAPMNAHLCTLVRQAEVAAAGSPNLSAAALLPSSVTPRS